MANNTKNLKEDEALLDAMSPIVNELIDRNYENSQDKIASQMAPLIGSAIRQQIKNQKDEVVDALYPVLGNMISRYVSKTFEEMMESINTQIQNGLSAEVIKRKIQAKIQGVSESELLLSQNANSNIRALFLIHKETGVVLTHAQNPSSPISEPEMMASMLSAISSFVNDWVEQNQAHQELGEIEFGGSKIIIENGGYCYLAVITDGAAYRSTYDSIRTVLESIIQEHGDSIREFNGDLTTFPNIEIIKKISTLLSSDKKERPKSKKLHPLIFILPILLLSWAAWSFYKTSQDNQLLTQVNEVLYKTKQLTTFRLDATLNDDTILLRGEVPFEYHKKLAEKKVRKIEGVTKVDNNLLVVSTLDDPMQISSNIFYLLSGFNLSNNAHLKYSYNYPSLLLEGTVRTILDKEKIINALQKVKGVSEIQEKITIVPPKIDTTIYFKKASSKLSIEQESKLIALVNILKPLDTNLTISVNGYSDSIGLASANIKLANKRAQNVAEYLKQRAKISQLVVAKGINSAPQGVDATKDPSKARCVIISWKQK